MKLFARWFICSEIAECATVYIILSNHSEPRRRWKWQTLVHRITTACRVKGGLLVSHASPVLHRLSPSRVRETHTGEPLRRARAGVRNTSAWDRIASSLTSRL
jgi:hypothetical protein